MAWIVLFLLVQTTTTFKVGKTDFRRSFLRVGLYAQQEIAYRGDLDRLQWLDELLPHPLRVVLGPLLERQILDTGADMSALVSSCRPVPSS